jgi:hypothetical protein
MSLQNRGRDRGAKVRQRNLEENLRVNPVEDGNYSTSTYTDQGNLFTAEINNSGYTGAYGENVANVVFATLDKDRTGSDYYYTIGVTYSIQSPSQRGWFGASIINSGEPFSIKSLTSSNPPFIDYIKGFIVKVIDEKAVSTSPFSTTVNYTLLCAITDGEPSQLENSSGFSFSTTRRVYAYEENTSPIGLESTYDASNQIVNFYWDDTTRNAVSYKMMVRSENVGEYNQLFEVSGNNTQFRGEVKPLIFPALSNNSLSGLQIVNTGGDYAFPVTKPTFLSDGLQPDATLYTDPCGSLEITDWGVVSVTGSTGTTINCVIKAIKNNAEIVNYQYVDTELGDCVCTGVTALSGPPYIYGLTLNFLKPPFSTISKAENYFNRRKIKVHTGAVLNDRGSSLSRLPKILYDKYKEGTKFSINVNSLGLAAGNYYWSISSIFDCEGKTYSNWSQESAFTVTFPSFEIYSYGGYEENGYAQG